MKTRTMMFMAMLGLAACDRATAPTPLARSALQATSASFDDGRQENQIIPIAGIVVSPCSGEQIAYEGSFHIVTSIEPTSDGFMLRLHSNTQGVSGVGLVTGTKYQIIDTFKENETIVSVPLNESAEFAEHFRVISEGNLDNFSVDLIATFTFPPRNVTYKFRNARCEG